MKQGLNVVILILTLIFNSNIKAQEEVRYDDDSLAYYLDQRDYISYFGKITELGDTAFKYKDEKYLFALGNLLQQDFEGLNASQRKKLRSTATQIGQKLKNLSGDLNEALKIYLIAHDNVENKVTLDSIAWYVENQIVTFYTMKGDFDKASYYSGLLEKSLKYHGLMNFLSRYYTNLGRALVSEFKVEEAIRSFEKGYALADSLGYKNGIFANALNLAELYNDNPQLGTGETYLLKASEYLPALISDNKYLEKKANLEFETAKFKSAQGNFIEGIQLYKDAIQTLSQYYSNTKRREFAQYYSQLAKSYLAIDSIQSAGYAINIGFSCILPEFKSEDDFPNIDLLYPENTLIDLFELKATLYERVFLGSSDKVHLEKAVTCINRALHVNDLIRETVIADPSKLVAIRGNKLLISKGISILYHLYALDSNSGYLDQARTFFNRSKSLLYGEKNRRNILVNLLSTEDRNKWALIQKKILALYEDKFNSGSDFTTVNGQILTYQEQIDEIFDTYNDANLTTYEHNEYIEYFMSDDLIYSFSSLNGQKRFIKIGFLPEYLNLASRLNDFILQKGMSMDEHILNEMYGFLIKPITQQLPDEFVIIPDGSIGYVPFEMLMNDEGKYLIENSTISYSFEFLTYTQVSEEDKKEWNVYCLAPQYKKKENGKEEVTRGSVYHLPYAKMEVDSIQQLYAEEAFTSQSSDKGEWDQNMNKTRIFHYAGHAIIRADNAYLVLSDSEDEKLQLTGEEIGFMHHPLEMVVLSACETGLGKMEHGEGIRSLGRSFMESGAKATVISLWNVNDKSTALIMTAFYKNLRAGMEKDAALRQSKLDYLKNAPARYVHPYFWAAFIPAGNMNVLINH